MPSFALIRNEAAGDDDARLLSRIAERDQAAFAELARRHAERFYRVARRFLRDQSEAQDIVQEAFFKLWEKPMLWQPGRNAAFTTWFYRVVANQCLDYERKKRPLQLVEEAQIIDERETREETMLRGEKQRMLSQRIKELPERQRMALILCFYEGLSNREAADAMGLHLKALQSLLMRAKATLKEQLSYLIEE